MGGVREASMQEIRDAGRELRNVAHRIAQRQAVTAADADAAVRARDRWDALFDDAEPTHEVFCEYCGKLEHDTETHICENLPW
jgi:recombinational DNA repair protein RecR